MFRYLLPQPERVSWDNQGIKTDLQHIVSIVEIRIIMLMSALSEDKDKALR
jgi:hypothetical protein